MNPTSNLPIFYQSKSFYLPANYLIINTLTYSTYIIYKLYLIYIIKLENIYFIKTIK